MPGSPSGKVSVLSENSLEGGSLLSCLVERLPWVRIPPPAYNIYSAKKKNTLQVPAYLFIALVGKSEHDI